MGHARVRKISMKTQMPHSVSAGPHAVLTNSMIVHVLRIAILNSAYTITAIELKVRINVPPVHNLHVLPDFLNIKRYRYDCTSVYLLSPRRLFFILNARIWWIWN